MRDYSRNCGDVGLLDKLARQTFGDSFEVPSEVDVERFLRL